MATSVPRKESTTFTPDTAAFPINRDGAERIPFIPPSALLGEEPESLRARVLRLFRENHGLLLIGAAQFFNSCMNMSVQMLNRLDRPVPPTEILTVRMIITWVITTVYMYCRGISHPVTGPPEVRILLVIRGTSGFFGIFGVYYSLQYLSLSDATVLTFLSPFVTSFAGTFFLGEPFSHRTLFAGLVSLIGVMLIARPEALFGPLVPAPIGSTSSLARGTSHERLLAVGASMIGVLGYSGAYTSIRAIGRRAHTLHSMNYYALFTTMLSVLIIAIRGTHLVIPRELKWCILLVSIAGFGFMSQFLLITGLQWETASRGSLGMYIQIVFATILERIFFQATPSILSLAGTAIILSTVLYTALTKEKGERRLTVQNNSSLPANAGVDEESGGGQCYSSCVAGERTPLLVDGVTVRKFV